jgi:ribonuclease HI
LVPKAEAGKYRKILDCRELNAHIKDTYFKMEGPGTIRDLIQPGDWATSLDIQSAFNHIPVSRELQPYLAFQYGERTFTYQAMPFGIKHAPRVFTLLMRQAAAAIRERWGARMVTYMDDILLLFRTKEEAELQTQEIAGFLEELGLTLSPSKCEMEPKQRITFLGWQWDLQQVAVGMTTGRRTATRAALEDWKLRATNRIRSPVRELAALLGKLNFLRLQFPDASLHMKGLDELKMYAVRTQGWAGECTPHPGLLGEIKWWTRKVSQNMQRRLQLPQQEVTITTDASPHGWGAVYQESLDEDGTQAFGFWSKEQQQWSSNRKELMAVTKALWAFGTQLKHHEHTTVAIRSDNTTVVADINRLSASQTLTPALLNLLTRARGLRIELRAAHIPGLTNTLADRLSRMGRQREYYLKEGALRRAEEELGFQVEYDPFAANPLIPSNTPPRHPGQGLDEDWTGKKLLLHPPPHLLLRTLNKAQTEGVTALLIAPTWRSQPWSPLLSRLTQRSLILGDYEEVMQTTPRFAGEGWQLPPGPVQAVILDTRTTADTTFSSDY